MIIIILIIIITIMQNIYGSGRGRAAHQDVDATELLDREADALLGRESCQAPERRLRFFLNLVC